MKTSDASGQRLNGNAGGLEPAHGASPGAARICIVNFTGDRANWGCTATSWELVRALNRNWPAVATPALDTIPLLPHHRLDQELQERHLPEIRRALQNPTPTGAQKDFLLRLARLRYGHHIDKLERADRVLFQAEGTMTGTEFQRGERLLLIPWLAAHVFDKPVLSLNQTLFVADEGFARPFFAVLSSLDTVWVREQASLHWLQQNGISRARLVPDTGFLTDPLMHGPMWKTFGAREYFCVTGSAALSLAEIPDYLSAARAVADGLGLHPVFACSAERDMKLIDKAKQAWPARSFSVLPRDTIYPAVADFLGGARLLVGGRYHLSLLASIGGTPSVLIGTNTYKLHGLVEMLGERWPIRSPSGRDEIVADARRLIEDLSRIRPRLRAAARSLREAAQAAYAGWYEVGRSERPAAPAAGFVAPPEAVPFEKINRRIAGEYRYAVDDSARARLGPPPRILRQLLPLSVYLRRGKDCAATFRCLRQLVEGNLDQVLEQLDARWLVSICDSYADWGDEVESRNALLISAFLGWERLAATYVRWSDPDRSSLRVDSEAPARQAKLWGGLSTVHLRRGDTTNNLLRRYAALLSATPTLLAIWRRLLELMRDSDSVMAALNVPHGHLFDEHTEWMSGASVADDVPPWRREGGRSG